MNNRAKKRRKKGGGLREVRGSKYRRHVASRHQREGTRCGEEVRLFVNE